DTYTEAGLATAAKGQAGEAILWFANAAARSELHPLRLRHNQVRFQSWLPEIAIPIHAFEAGGGWNKKLLFHPSGQYLLTVAGHCEIRDLRAGSLLRLPLDGHVTNASWSPDGKWLALTSGSTVGLFEFPDGKEVDRLIHPGEVHCLAFSPDGKRL